MNIYLVTQTEETGYDTYDAFVCAAESEESARDLHPGGDSAYWRGSSGIWCSSPNEATAELIGIADEGTPKGIILASFNAG